MRLPIANLDAMAGFSAPICSAVRSFRVQKKSENNACNTQRWVYCRDMKSIFSPLAERQTVRVNNINARVAVRVRQWKIGEQTETTKDVMVDGYCYTPAVSDNWLSQNLAKICDIVAGKTSEAHLGYGQWEAA